MTIQSELRQYLDQWEAAYTANNVSALKELYEDDVLFSPHGYKVLDGKDETVNFLSLIASTNRIEIRQEIDRVVEDGELVNAMGRAYAVLFDKETGDEVARDAARWLILLKRSATGELRMYRDFSQSSMDVTFDS